MGKLLKKRSALDCRDEAVRMFMRLTSWMRWPSPPPLSRKRERGANTRHREMPQAFQIPIGCPLSRKQERGENTWHREMPQAIQTLKTPN
ncbi:hypothetical protein CBM2637_B40053 [Cupriavidus taiwanensis]|nr:hypothetical protein CBM2637_B40053 [Cupriavidus taiwanensis]